MFNKLQQEQRDLDASYRQSLQNKKEHETRDQDQDNNASFEGISEAEYNKRHMKALKDADPGFKRQASSVKLSNQPEQASSDKRQALRCKLQASSHKRQAP